MNNIIIVNLNTNSLPSNDLHISVTGRTRTLTNTDTKLDSAIPVH